HPVRIDEEMVIGPGDSRRDVREDEVVPAVEGNRAIGGGEVHASGPFGGAHAVLHRADEGGIGVHELILPEWSESTASTTSSSPPSTSSARSISIRACWAWRRSPSPAAGAGLRS